MLAAVFWDELSRTIRRLNVEEAVMETDGKTSGENAKEQLEFARSGFTALPHNPCEFCV
jgi:hypothetical protein